MMMNGFSVVVSLADGGYVCMLWRFELGGRLTTPDASRREVLKSRAKE